MKRPEQALQIACMKYLKDLSGVTKNFFAYHVGNGGFRTPVEASILKSMGVTAGVPDIVIHLNGGKSIFVELKAKKGKLSDNQETVHAILKGFGYRVEVITAEHPQDAVNQLNTILIEEGVHRG